MVPNPTLQYGEYEDPEPTGKVYIYMEKTTAEGTVLFIKKYQRKDGWMVLCPEEGSDISECWAFSKQGAKRIIERLKAKSAEAESGECLVKYGTIEEYDY